MLGGVRVGGGRDPGPHIVDGGGSPPGIIEGGHLQHQHSPWLALTLPLPLLLPLSLPLSLPVTRP